jgi:UDPglucose 6-dehydrogenase
VLNVSVVGTGYVGLVSGTCFAEIGHKVTCIDINEKKIEGLKKGICPIYEPGLQELIDRNSKAKRLNFECAFDSISNAKITFLAVDTPAGADGKANLTNLLKAAETAGKNISAGGVVVIKSTVPVGTHLKVKEVIAAITDKKFEVINNPEFLKEGSAVDDFLRPDRVVIGCETDEGWSLMESLYEPVLRSGKPIIRMSNLSAEMTKYAANCFLATKISFINEIANLCDLTGAHINEVRKGIMSDTRIGSRFLYPGIGYGGSCFPKDVQALLQTGKEYNYDLKIIRSAHETNESQKDLLFKKLMAHFDQDIAGKTFSFWGVSFKPNTDDIREAPSIVLANLILDNGGKIKYYDPVGAENFSMLWGNNKNIERVNDPYDALSDSSGLLLLTEWMEFRNVDFHRVEELLKVKVIFDGRNIYSNRQLQKFGFTYYGIGKGKEI